MSKQITVDGLQIGLRQSGEADFVNITDIARRRNENKPSDTIAMWLRNVQTLLYLEAWEELNNPTFKLAQMSEFRLLAQTNRFSVTPKRYIESTRAIGLISKAGNAGGTWAHSDIALEFCTWLEAAVQSLFFQRISTAEKGRSGDSIARISYRTHHRFGG